MVKILKWTAGLLAAVLTASATVSAADFSWEKWTDSSGNQLAGYRENGIIMGLGEITYLESGARYKGTFVNGLRQGTGIYEWADGSVYRGEYEAGETDGLGIHTYVNKGDSSGDSTVTTDYEGEFVKGKRQGLGYYQWPDGEIYVGEWTDGEPGGLGIMLYTDGSIKAGVWQNGVFQAESAIEQWTDENGNQFAGNREGDIADGRGLAVYKKSGNCYVGDFSGGRLQGRGVFLWKSGDRYIGEFSGGKCDGIGLYRWKNHKQFDAYLGQYREGSLSGTGIMCLRNGGCYQGQFADNTRNGKGMLYLKNGDRFDGSWKEDFRNGPGTYYYSDGSKLMGNWENGVLEGYALRCNADGSLEPGFWEGGIHGENGAEFWTLESGDTQCFGIRVNGMLHGDGILIYSDEELLCSIGYFQAGTEILGTVFMEQSRYEGSFSDSAWKNGWQYFYDQYGILHGIPYTDGQPGEVSDEPESGVLEIQNSEPDFG